MSKSKSLNQEIEKVLSEKSDKSDIQYDQQIIQKMIGLKESGSSKDEILDSIYSDVGGFKMLDKYWKESGCQISGGSGYRQETVKMFIDSDGEVTQKEWEERMISGGFLKKIVNYRQHFSTYYHLYHHKMMS